MERQGSVFRSLKRIRSAEERLQTFFPPLVQLALEVSFPSLRPDEDLQRLSSKRPAGRREGGRRVMTYVSKDEPRPMMFLRSVVWRVDRY